MASRYFGINRGQQQTDIVEGSSTNSKDIELAVDLTKSVTKKELLLAMDLLANYILRGTYPAQ